MNNILRSMPYFLIFIFTIIFAFALPTDNLKYYYSFDELITLSAYNRTAIDELGHSNFTYNNPSYDIVYVALDTNGKKGNSLYTGNLENNYGYMKNINMSLLNGKNITINYWFKVNNSNPDFYNFLPYFTSYYNETKTLSQYYRNFMHSYQSIYGNNLTVSTAYQTKSYSIPVNNTWYMLTLVYYQNGTIITFANAGYWLSNNTNFILLGNEGYYNLNSDYSNFDEMSIWDTPLNQNDVIALYNNGNGMNFIEILSSEIIPNYTYDGYYHDYCWYYILCHDYNVSEGLCDDSPRKVCSQECADTFDSYQLAGLENETSSFSGLCTNNSYYYQYPSYEGNTSGYLIDLCIGTYLCHYYNVSGHTTDETCPNYINNVLNKINCISQTGSIVAECFDTFDTYSQQNTYPPNNNYSGYCSECKSDCVTENSSSCYSIIKVQKCEKYASCLKWFTTQTCGVGQECLLGSCVKNLTEDTGGGSGGVDAQQGDFLYPPTKKSVRYIIPLLVIFLTIGGFVAVGYSIDMIQGSFVVGIVLSFFELIIFTVLGWLPVWILITLILMSVASIILVSKLPNNNSAG